MVPGVMYLVVTWMAIRLTVAWKMAIHSMHLCLFAEEMAKVLLISIGQAFVSQGHNTSKDPCLHPTHYHNVDKSCCTPLSNPRGTICRKLLFHNPASLPVLSYTSTQ